MARLPQDRLPHDIHESQDVPGGGRAQVHDDVRVAGEDLGPSPHGPLQPTFVDEPPGAIVLVTHDEGAVDALDPERVLLLPDGVEDTNITGVPSAELTLLEPRRGLETKDGKIEVAGTSDAESVVVSFQWRGNLDKAKRPPPETTLPVKDGVFRGASDTRRPSAGSVPAAASE